MKTKEAQLKKLQTSKEDSDKLIQAKTQEVIAFSTVSDQKVAGTDMLG